MKMKCVLVTLLIGACSAYSDLTWDCLDLAAKGASNTWFVQMFQDVNGDSSLGTIRFALTTGEAAQGTGYADDILLTSYTTSLLTAKDVTSFSKNYTSWPAITSNNVYTVIFNSSGIGSANTAWVVDTSVKTITSISPQTYALGSGSSYGFQAMVPEPTTFLLFGIGGMGAFLLRRKQQRSED